MIEKIIKNYLQEQTGVPVYLEMPLDRPHRFIIAEKTGSKRSNYICSATFALQSYAESMEDAATLNEDVKVAMDSIVVLGEIARSELNSDYPYTDTSSKHYRYQAVYDLVHY